MPAEFTDLEIPGLSPAACGRKVITLAEHAMPGLTAIREECAAELLTKPGEYPADPYVPPEHLDGKAARLHLDSPGVEPATLRKEQVDCIDVKVEGPCEGDRHRSRAPCVPRTGADLPRPLASRAGRGPVEQISR